MPTVEISKAEAIACDALKIADPEERSAFLQSACGGNDELKRAAEGIVAECDRIDRFLSGSWPMSEGDLDLAAISAGNLKKIVAEFDSDEMVGREVGAYRIVEKIGEGGCGAVYVAEQEQFVRRRVALKIIKLGMDTKNVISRFEAERQALAMMSHPNIARVFDAGATETGRPYFVMELVRGVRITAYCDDQKLGVRQRLELFIQVCSAVQHAHQKGIVHRDLKPSNILITTVDGKPLPKVIDFGIAKATSDTQLTDGTSFTASEHFIGTPAYMSPEQAKGSAGSIDTRSDIYSLGVLLYELLTGFTPFEQAELLSAGVDEMRRILLDCEPVRPSARLSALDERDLNRVAQARHVDSSKLKACIRGDLDWIAMCALEKDPGRRYLTANGLAMDVQRHLESEPVSASPPSRIYRFRKMVRRNRTLFAALAAVSVALIAGFGTSTWLLVRERVARQEADRLRTEADARTKIAQAALLIDRSQLLEADQLVADIEVPDTEPSLEAAKVFRTLADWNVEHGRWTAAADRFLKLQRANRIDRSDITEHVSIDLLGAGPSLVMAGDHDHFRELVKDALRRFAHTNDPVAAEQVVKNSLILPADAATLSEVAPLVELVHDSFLALDGTIGVNDFYREWQPLALSLYAYRSGNFPRALFWGEQSLTYPDSTSARMAMTHLVLAMTYGRLKDRNNATRELAAGSELVESFFPYGSVSIADSEWSPAGGWHDKVIAYLLLQEALEVVRP